MHALLTQLAAHSGQQPAARRITPGYLAALLRACCPVPAPSPAARTATAPPGLAESLTDRETDVLRLIAARSTPRAHLRDAAIHYKTLKNRTAGRAV